MMMKIDYKDIIQIRPAKKNLELTEIVLMNGQSIYIRNNNKQFCISLSVTFEGRTELWIER